MNEALIEKVAEAIRQSAVMKMEEGEDLALYVAKIWRAYARAALATIEASRSEERLHRNGCASFQDPPEPCDCWPIEVTQQAEVAACMECERQMDDSGVYGGKPNPAEATLRFCLRHAKDVWPPFERTLGSTRNESSQSGGGSR